MKTIWIRADKSQVQEAEIQPPEFLQALKELLGTDEPVSQIIGPGTILWVDARGLLRPEPKLWSFKGAEHAIMAGPAIIHGIDPNMATLLDAPFSVETAIEQIDWRDDVTYDGLEESLRVVQGPQGFMPVLQRVPRFKPVSEAPTAPPEVPGIKIWTIYRGDVGFDAYLREFANGGMKTIKGPVRGDDLDDLRDELRLGDGQERRFDRQEGDHPSIVETWVL